MFIGGAAGGPARIWEGFMSLNDRLRGIAAALAATLLAGAIAEAAAPQQKTQAPGYYRMMLGEIEVTALSDGIFPMDTLKLLTNITPMQLDAALARSFLKNPVDASVNGFLVNTGSKLVLIDTGAGTLFGPTLGKLLANLKASGYAGSSVDGKPAFPNAVVRAAQQEADFWLSNAGAYGCTARGPQGWLPGCDEDAESVRLRREIQAL
jgi:glyoxylase-like metal-dependent hydrolase (beta-lactamase superfamily II)